MGRASARVGRTIVEVRAAVVGAGTTSSARRATFGAVGAAFAEPRRGFLAARADLGPGCPCVALACEMFSTAGNTFADGRTGIAVLCVTFVCRRALFSDGS